MLHRGLARVVQGVSVNSLEHSSTATYANAPPSSEHRTVTAARSRSPKRVQMHANGARNSVHAPFPGPIQLHGSMRHTQHPPSTTAATQGHSTICQHAQHHEQRNVLDIAAHTFVPSTALNEGSSAYSPSIDSFTRCPPLEAAMMLAWNSTIISPLTVAISPMRSHKCIWTLVHKQHGAVLGIDCDPIRAAHAYQSQLEGLFAEGYDAPSSHEGFSSHSSRSATNFTTASSSSSSSSSVIYWC